MRPERVPVTKTTKSLYLDSLSLLFPQFYPVGYLSRLTSDVTPSGKPFLSSLSSQPSPLLTQLPTHTLWF